ncbi:50S ribosomal protein L10 [Campylobacter sp. JMF_01 NE2]|uniref:50S ribosomal protein L10 n=1 Tax=unclassified Campylobacter TaxID=2593542 RepID=UPI0022E9A9D4|nr:MULTISPECIES: 50S ribosomal protein L10 [unclassified Campylobacter]MDA3042820.1 50S ribosomal protein L10 [Campylobacter sp. JMF_09 ED2]MDA3044345.1 50S ribosomal protein L10 [Campylobacter sp. JMF_07 ED4]MDA3046157.1 50S ribosomal protein L10 [Campylobacter sp. VBCF_06 NA8]MDA3048288.1 50S ribosomal protein L10 [Campylobacter sp. JMF_08 NE1]MDA3049487.1 50S ribosomal protein L10 [Campylobacter sp. JMF_15 NE4]
MTRDEKSQIVAELSEAFKNSEAIVISDFKGLDVKKLEELRNSARELDVKVRVIKNTLAAIALKNAEKDGMSFKDTNIFLWGDQLSVCKVAAKFEEKNEAFALKTAYVDGEVTSIEKVRALSKMPSRDELIAMLLQVWNAPIQNFTIGLNALKEKKEQTA